MIKIPCSINQGSLLRLSGVVEVAVKISCVSLIRMRTASPPISSPCTSPDYNSFASGGSARLLYGEYGFDKYPAYTLTSVQEYQQSNDPSKLKKFQLSDIKPQSVDAFELGYSALISNVVLIDVLGYYSTWKNFIGYVNVANTPERRM